MFLAGFDNCLILCFSQFATDFSRFSLQDNGVGKPFQNLLFLIRDWVDEEDYPFGYDGGRGYLEEAVFKIKAKQISKMKRMRKFIKDSFESIKCFLMPHPGSAVTGKKAFNGSWGVIDKQFVDQLKVLVPSMLAPENLSVKKIAGEEMTGETLYSHMQFYLKLFQSNKYPKAKSIYESTVTKFLQDLVSSSASMYKELMVNGTDAVETHSDFGILHLNSKNEAMEFYNKEKKIGDNKTVSFYRNSLIGEIEKLHVEQGQTVFLQIQNRMKDREIEESRNATLRKIREFEELENQKILAELKANETIEAILKNTKDLEARNQQIADFQTQIREDRKVMQEAMFKQNELMTTMITKQASDMNVFMKDFMEQMNKQHSEQMHVLRETQARKRGPQLPFFFRLFLPFWE
jgi:hypothetical protein